VTNMTPTGRSHGGLSKTSERFTRSATGLSARSATADRSRKEASAGTPSARPPKLTVLSRRRLQRLFAPLGQGLVMTTVRAAAAFGVVDAGTSEPHATA